MTDAQSPLPEDNEPLRATGLDDDTLTEALEQLETINREEDERRKTTDSKISSAQNALGFTVTLAGGSAAFAFLSSPQYDLWHGVALILLVAATSFFFIAAVNITNANEPRAYQMRKAPAIRRKLNQHQTKRELQTEAINDLVSNVTANIEATNTRMGLYMDAVWWLRPAMAALTAVPLVILIAYATNMIFGVRLPTLLTITSAANASPADGTQAPRQPRPHREPRKAQRRLIRCRPAD